jgi:hypothetical protein
VLLPAAWLLLQCEAEGFRGITYFLDRSAAAAAAACNWKMPDYAVPPQRREQQQQQ